VCAKLLDETKWSETRDETLVRLKTVLRLKRRDRDHIFGFFVRINLSQNVYMYVPNYPRLLRSVDSDNIIIDTFALTIGLCNYKLSMSYTEQFLQNMNHKACFLKT